MPEIELFTLLSDFFTSLLAAVPSRCRATLLELLIGLLQAPSAHLTDVIWAIWALGADKHFTTYYWFVRKAKWSWLALLAAWLRVTVHWVDEKVITLIIDDFIVPRSSKKAPGVTSHYDHAKKSNRPDYLNGQGWVIFSRVIEKAGRIGAIHLGCRLIRRLGNRSKLKTARLIGELAFPFFEGHVLRLLIDAWYMKSPLVVPLLKQFPNLHVIGQVRHDTALFHVPTAEEQPKKQGRKKIYGKKVQFDELPEQAIKLTLYSKEQTVRYRSCECVARFLKGRRVRAVWVLLEDAAKWKLLLSTNPELTPVEVMTGYDRRWKVEPAINDFKNRFGLLEAWQQSRQTLARWVALLTVSYSFVKLLAILLPTDSKNLIPSIPWRAGKPITAAWMRLAIIRLFSGFRLLPESRRNIGRFYHRLIPEWLAKQQQQINQTKT